MPRPPVRGRASRLALPPPPPPAPPPIPEVYVEPDAALPPETLATRRWMLFAGGLGLLAVVAAVVMVVTLSDEGSTSSPGQTADVTGAVTTVAEATATVPASASTPADDDSSDELARTVASLQAQLKAAEIQGGSLQEQLAAAQESLQEANERLTGVEADLASTSEERDQLQTDLAATEADLDAANEERVALLGMLEEARAQAQENEALAIARGDYVTALETCLAGYKEALSHAVVEDWGGVPISIQNAGASCSHPGSP